MIELSGNGISSLACGGLAFLLIMIAAIFGIRARLRGVNQIRMNIKNGLYSKPEFSKRIRIILLVQVLILIALSLSVAFAMVEKSVLGIIAAGILILISMIIGFTLHRLMIKGAK